MKTLQNAWPQLRGPLYFALALGAVMALYHRTLLDLIYRGARIGSYSQGVLVLPTALVLAWTLRSTLRDLPIRASAAGLLGLALTGAAWLIGQLTLTHMLADGAVVAMVPMLVLALFGTRWLRTLLFPLGFLFFAIPYEWGPVIPSLVEWTARFTMFGLKLSGVPIYREGAYLMVPSGSWTVADACSGISYLNTCVMLGVLYAWLMYNSLSKRLLFIGGAVALGVVGNWLRAYLTVLVAHLSDNRYLRDDHGSFGWILFAVLLFAYFWFGRRYSDPLPASATAAPAADAPTSRARHLGLCLVAALLVGIWPLLDRALDVAPASATRALVSEWVSAGGWTRVGTPGHAWAPTLHQPVLIQQQTFEKNGRRVELFIGIFHRQHWDSRLVTSVNQLVDSDDPAWSLIDRGHARFDFAGQAASANTGLILGGGQKLLAWQWFWVDPEATSSGLRAKWRLLANRLRGQDDISAWVVISTGVTSDTEAAARVLDEFIRDTGAALAGSMPHHGP